MCGIVAYKGETPIKFEKVLSIAYRNRHRGEDGIGIIYEQEGKIRVIKNLYSLVELHSGMLSKDRYCKRTRIGSFELTCNDEVLYNTEQTKFAEYVTKLKEKESKFVYLHHRKGTYGDQTIENQHPIIIDDKYYIHNGTAYGIESVRGYLELINGMVFTTDTDTEIIAILYNLLLEQLDGDKAKVIEEMGKMFPSGFGILIEITKDLKVTIIKDYSRSIWYYGLDEGYMLMSEPSPDIVRYSQVGMVADGIYDANTLTYYDYIDKYTLADDCWNTYSGIDDYRKEKVGKCDICKETKYIKRTLNLPNHPSITNQSVDICFECLSMYKKKEEEKEETITEKMSKFGQYVGLVKEKVFTYVND